MKKILFITSIALFNHNVDAMDTLFNTFRDILGGSTDTNTFNGNTRVLQNPHQLPAEPSAKMTKVENAEEKAKEEADHVDTGLDGEANDEAIVDTSAELFGTGTTDETVAPNKEKEKEGSPDSDSTFNLQPVPKDGDKAPSSDTGSRDLDSDRAGGKKVVSKTDDESDNANMQKSKEPDSNGLTDEAFEVFGDMWSEMTKEPQDDVQAKIDAAVSDDEHSPQAFINTLNKMPKREPLAICTRLANGTFHGNCKVFVPDQQDGNSPFVQKPFSSVHDHFTLITDQALQSKRLQAVPDMIDNFYKMQPDKIDMSTINNIVARYLSALKIVPLLYDYDDQTEIFDRARRYADELKEANTDAKNPYAAKLIQAIYNVAK